MASFPFAMSMGFCLGAPETGKVSNMSRQGTRLNESAVAAAVAAAAAAAAAAVTARAHCFAKRARLRFAYMHDPK